MFKATLYVGKSPLQRQLIELLRKMAAADIDEKVVNLSTELPEKYLPYLEGGYWFQPIGSYCLILPESFFRPSNRRFFNKAFKTYNAFLKPIRHVQIKVNQEMKRDYNPDEHGIRPITYFSIIAEVTKKLTLAFLITDPISEDNFQNQVEGVKVFIQEYFQNRRQYSKKINRLHKIDQKTVFLLWSNSRNLWEPQNALYYVGHEKMLRYKKGRDNRFAKPLMIINESNLNQEFTFPTNWTIHGRIRRYTMNRPNDIAMYQSVANKALKRARDKFDEIHKKQVTELILPEEQASEFLDYFEEIIQAAIMSYTTIECAANSCIPFYHKYKVEEKGVTKMYNKESIELSFSLRDKLKLVIPQIVNAPSPVAENGC